MDKRLKILVFALGVVLIILVILIAFKLFQINSGKSMEVQKDDPIITEEVQESDEITKRLRELQGENVPAPSQEEITNKLEDLKAPPSDDGNEVNNESPDDIMNKLDALK